jgi:hypothetical protein
MGTWNAAEACHISLGAEPYALGSNIVSAGSTGLAASAHAPGLERTHQALSTRTRP